MTTTALLRPCMWGLAFAGLLMTTSPAAAMLPIAVMNDFTDTVVLASPATTEVVVADQASAERVQPERVADSEIQEP